MRPKADGGDRGMPILWHIMKIYAAHGVNDFVICCGYKSYVIKNIFQPALLFRCRFDFKNNSVGFIISRQRLEGNAS